MRRVKLVSISAVALLALACDPSSEESGSEETGEPSACAEETRAMSYGAGMEVMGEAGLAKIMLVDASPAPPIRDLNDWQLSLMDADGAPLEVMSIEVTPWMPDHGHGSPNPDTALLAGDETGSYELVNLDLFMAGYWEVHFDIEIDAETSERVTYGFCVD